MLRCLLTLTALVGLLALWTGCGTDHEPLGPSGSSKQTTSAAVAAKLPAGVRVLIVFRDLPDAALVRRAGGDVRYAYQIVPAIAATLPQVAVDRLRSHPAVALMEPDAQMWAIDAELDQTWGVDRIDAEVVHEVECGQIGWELRSPCRCRDEAGRTWRSLRRMSL
jgi:hypothetical protein